MAMALDTKNPKYLKNPSTVRFIATEAVTKILRVLWLALCESRRPKNQSAVDNASSMTAKRQSQLP